MLNASMRNYQQRIDKYLHFQLNLLDDLAPELKSAMMYSVLIGGKRIRPFLVYSIGEMLGISLDKLDPCAAAIECIHAYSLIHDDLPAMDNDELRRGHPTVHIKYNEAIAILAGDALQAFAFDILSKPSTHFTPTQQLAMIKSLASASGYQGMCGGQAMDLASANKTISLDELTQLHQSKTGALISCAIELVLISYNAKQQISDPLRIFGHAIGLAFQVQDDILDITATTEQIGKPQGSDYQANKSTFPKLLGLTKAKETADKLINDALSALTKLPYNTQIIADFAHYIVARRK